MSTPSARRLSLSPSAATPPLPPMQPIPQQNLLALKVMRLSRPSFEVPSPVFVHNVQDGGDVAASPDVAAAEPAAALGEQLLLPNAFGSIYLGETFTVFLSLNNESAVDVERVSLTVDLQTATQRIPLYASTAAAAAATSSSRPPSQPQQQMSITPVTSLAGGKNMEVKLSYEIKELGMHILICSVAYAFGGSPSSPMEERTFRKSYRFSSLNPLAVKTKVNTRPNGAMFLEAQVQNISETPLVLERMRFDPVPELFLVDDLNLSTLQNMGIGTPMSSLTASVQSMAVSEGRRSPSPEPRARTQYPPKPTIFASQFLNVNDIRQYLFAIRPRNTDSNAWQSSTGIGKLDILWRRAMGEPGRLQTSQLQRKVTTPDVVTIHMSIPQATQILLERKFTLHFSIQNVSAQDVLLSLQASKHAMTSVVLLGSTGRFIGRLVAGQSIDVDLQFFALAAGIQPLVGFHLKDELTGVIKAFDTLPPVFVLRGEGGRSAAAPPLIDTNAHQPPPASPPPLMSFSPIQTTVTQPVSLI